MNQKKLSQMIAAAACALLLCACSQEKAGTVDVDAYRAALKGYDPVVEQVVTQITALAQATTDLSTALTADEIDLADQRIDAQAKAADALIAALGQLEQLEDRLKGTPPDQAGQITRPLLFTLGVGLVIYGTYKFAQKMKSLSDDLSAERKKRDEAAERMTQGDETAEEDYKKAKAEMNKTGEEAITELTTKVTTDMVLSPLNPTSVGGLIIKEKAGDLLQEGLKVITATGDCKDQQSSSCRIAVQKTDSAGKAKLPAGNQAVLISTQGKARVEIKELTVLEGKNTTVIIEMVPIEQATPEGSPPPAPDAGPPAGQDGGQSGDPDGGSGSGEVGPKCAELAACCPKVDTPLALRQQCEDTVAKNIESHCSIVLAGSLGMYYCR